MSDIILPDDPAERLEWAEDILRTPNKWLEFANGEEIVRTALSVVTDSQRAAKQNTSTTDVRPSISTVQSAPHGRRPNKLTKTQGDDGQTMAKKMDKRGFRMESTPTIVEDSFADGISGFAVGRGVLKLDLYRVQSVDQETGQEVRTHSHRLVLPIVAMQELATVLQQFQQAAKAKKNNGK